MSLGRLFRVCRSFLPLIAACSLAACGSDPNAFGEPFSASAEDAGASDAQADAGKSGAGAGSSAGSAAAGGGAQAAGGSGGSGGTGAADDADDDDAGSDDDDPPAGTGGSGSAGHAAGSGGAGGTASAAVSFGDIFSGTIAAGCTCHSGGAGGLDLGTRAAAYKNLVSMASSSCAGEQRVVAGNADASVLFHAITHTALGKCKVPNMPQGGRMLTQAQLDQVKAWITAGAPDN